MRTPCRVQRPAWRRKLGWWAEAIFLWSFWRLTGTLSAARAATLGNRLFRWLGPRLKKQQFVRNNIRLAFPELDAQRRTRLARDVWGNFGTVLAEYPHLHKLALNKPAAGPAIERVFDDAARAVVAEKRPAVYITAHMANWELAGAAISAAGIPLSVVYAPQGNPLLDRLLQSARRSLGCQFIAKHNALRRLLAAIRSGRSVGILPDQRVDSGAPIAFFGHAALTTTSPAWLALKSACPLIPVQIERTGCARYRATFHAPMHFDKKDPDRTAILNMTTAINQLFESWIRNQPGQWLCMRRRWPAFAQDLQTPGSGDQP